MSQEELASALGIALQQVQNYEKGSHRIGASRLFEMARILGVSMQFFFEGISASDSPCTGAAPSSGEADLGAELKDFTNSREAAGLNRAFLDIESSKLRRTILTLVRSLGDLTERKD